MGVCSPQNVFQPRKLFSEFSRDIWSKDQSYDKDLTTVFLNFFTHLGLDGGYLPGVPVNKGITIVHSLFRSHWLAVVYCLVVCINSCVPVH